MTLRYLFALLGAVALIAAGCGGDDEEAGGGGGGGGGGEPAAATGETQGAKKAPASGDAAKGEVTYCTGKDTSGAQIESVKLFNEANEAKGLSAKLLEFPTSADAQREQFIQRQRAKSGECDIFYSDVIWTAEFAAQKWLLDMTDNVNARKDDFIPSTLETVKYDEKYWGVPKQTDAGFLYYRKDQVKQVPETWQAVYEEAAKQDGIVYQGAPYEGLTVDFLELAFAAGGKVLSDDGKKAEFNSPENLKALQFMVDGIKNGAAKKAVTTYMEEEARRSFEAGRATFMRNWPYAFALGNESDIKGKFEVAPYPAFEGGGKAGILGGHNLVISAFSKNPEGAVALIDYLTAPEAIKRDAAEYSLAPTLVETYDDPEVKEALPFAAELKQA
ncbi:MAG: Predicted trehalose ABC transporter, substrate-binding component, Archaea-type, partial [uncultured Phycisphaerae bacterium]